MHSDSERTRIQKLQLREQLLNEFGVLLPGPLLAGITVHDLTAIRRIFQEASERWLQDQDPTQRTRIAAHETFVPGLPLHPTTGKVEVEMQARERCAQCGRVAGMPTEPCLQCPDVQRSMQAPPPPEPVARGTSGRTPGQHMVVGVNTPTGNRVCYCNIGQDHGPVAGLGGSTHV